MAVTPSTGNPTALIQASGFTPEAGETRSLVEEWVKILGLVFGIAGPPLIVIGGDWFARLESFAAWGWTVGAGAGLIMMAAGLVYWLRWARGRRRAARRDLGLELVRVDELPRRRAYTHLRRPRTPPVLALEALEELGPKVAALQEMAAEGLITPEEFREQLRRLNAPPEAKPEAEIHANRQLEVLQRKRRAGLISEAQFRRELAVLSRQAEDEQSTAAPGLRSAAVLIALGALVVLPAAVSALTIGSEILDAYFVGLYFSSPALLLWAIFEFQRLWIYRSQRPQGAAQWLDLLSGAFQILSAFGLWNFFGLAYSTGEVVWLLWISTGLALLGAVFATASAILERRARRKAVLPQNGGETARTPAGAGNRRPDGGPEPAPDGPAASPETAARDTGALQPPAETGTGPHVPEAGSTPAPVERPGPAENPAAEGSPVVGLAERAAEEGPAKTERSDESQTRPGRFEIFRGRDEQFYFRLRAANGEVVLRSEGYVALAGCRNGIRSVMANAALEERFETRTAANGEAYFVLKAANHQVIGVSETYSSPRACARGIRAVQGAAANASIEEI